MTKMLHLGCGQTLLEGWENFDNSLSVRMAQMPVFFSLLKSLRILNDEQVRFIKFCQEKRIGFADVTRRIPAEDSSVDAIYSSHMLEHLSHDQADMFLEECVRVLRPGGILRLSVPDLKKLTMDYINDEDAVRFITRLQLRPSCNGRKRSRLVTVFIGDRGHKWMYDGASLSALLSRAGFVDTQVVPPGTTCIVQTYDLDLFERQEESVYVEARKRV